MANSPDDEDLLVALRAAAGDLNIADELARIQSTYGHNTATSRAALGTVLGRVVALHQRRHMIAALPAGNGSAVASAAADAYTRLTEQLSSRPLERLEDLRAETTFLVLGASLHGAHQSRADAEDHLADAGAMLSVALAKLYTLAHSDTSNPDAPNEDAAERFNTIVSYVNTAMQALVKYGYPRGHVEGQVIHICDDPSNCPGHSVE